MSREDIDNKLDIFISKLLREINLEDWNYLASGLALASEAIQKSPVVNLNTDPKEFLKKFMEEN